jgi:hypothetical protein
VSASLIVNPAERAEAWDNIGKLLVEKAVVILEDFESQANIESEHIAGVNPFWTTVPGIREPPRPRGRGRGLGVVPTIIRLPPRAELDGEGDIGVTAGFTKGQLPAKPSSVKLRLLLRLCA